MGDRVLLMRSFGLAMMLGVSAFAQHSPATLVARPRAVYLITVDGTRWQDVFAVDAREHLPNLYSQFVDRGIVVGRDSKFEASGWNHVSLPGYLEITRGHPSTSDCTDNYCRPNPLGQNVADFFQTVAVFAGWDEIDLTFTHRPHTIVNIGRSIRSDAWKCWHLHDNQTFPKFFSETYRPDSLTSSALYQWQAMPKVGMTRFVWLSLGDTDEWAHAGDRPRYLKSLEEADTMIGQLMLSAPKDEEATFIVTADHGRSTHDWTTHGEYTSGRLWLMMTGAGVPTRGWVTYDTTHTLSDVLPTIRTLLDPQNPQKGSLL